MISIDGIVMSFISGNWFTISLALGLLKIIAQSTKWVLDDKIVTLLTGFVGEMRKSPPGQSRE